MDLMKSRKELSEVNRDLDLLDLIRLLWRERLLIISIITLTTITGAGVSLALSPIYRASVLVEPPPLRDLTELYKFSKVTVNWNIQPLQELDIFLRDLTSYTKLNQFLNSQKANSWFSAGSGHSREVIDKFRKRVQVERIKRVNDGSTFKISFSETDPKLTVNVLEALLESGIASYRERKNNEFLAYKSQKILELKENAKKIKEEHLIKVNLEISKLREAIEIRKRLNFGTIKDKDNLVYLVPPQRDTFSEEMRFLYSQDEANLEVEIETLLARLNDPLKVEGLAVILKELESVNLLSLDGLKVNPIRIIGLEDLTAKRIKPNRLVITVMSCVFGFVFAIVFVLARNDIRNRRAVA
jgi:LPS O-antigen subunit length determinant protein (WzzB/FepE family)